jgi:hypothetical protein
MLSVQIFFLMYNSCTFYSRNPSSRTMALGSTQPLTEMSTRDLLGGKERPKRKADNLTSICDSTVYKMWEPQRHKPMAFMVCYRDIFTFTSVQFSFSFAWGMFIGTKKRIFV